MKLKQIESAFEYCSKAIELDPGNDTYYAMRAFLFARLKQHDKALEDFNLLMLKEELKPVHNQTRIYRWIGMMFLEFKDIASALIHFNKSIEKTTSASSKAYTHLWSGIALYMKGDIKIAFKEFITAFKLDYTDVVELLLLGNYL